MIVPESFKTIDLEKYMPERRRFRGNFSTTSIEDFCVYANDHDAGSIFVDTDKRRMSAAPTSISAMQAVLVTQNTKPTYV